MKLLLTLFFYFLMIHESSAQISPEDLGDIIEQIRIKYAPDKRTAIFNINYSINEKAICLSGETNIL
jgi:hypothetical protein